MSKPIYCIAGVSTFVDPFVSFASFGSFGCSFGACSDDNLNVDSDGFFDSSMVIEVRLIEARAVFSSLGSD